MLRKEERAIQRAKREKQKERFNGSQRFGDDDFLLEDVEELDDASWLEVINACCCHGVSYWLAVFGSLVIMLALLYLFLFALELLGSGAKIMSGCRAGELFGDSANPVVGVMIGVLVTAFLQSSSTTTSIVVTLVGADALTIKEGVYFIMGANIGTAVTSTIVSLAMIRQMEQFERAVTGAAIHDAFNLLTVAILLPLEASTSYLFKLTENVSHCEYHSLLLAAESQNLILCSLLSSLPSLYRVPKQGAATMRMKVQSRSLCPQWPKE